MPSRFLPYLRSIRVSLILYFLLLFGAALAATSLFAYQKVEEVLADNELNTETLWKQQFEDQKAHAEADFDIKLVDRAWELKKPIIWRKFRIHSLDILGMLGALPHTGVVTSMLLPWAESTNASVIDAVAKMRGRELRIQRQNREDENYHPVVEDLYYFQTYRETYRVGFGKGLQPKEYEAYEASDTLGGLVWKLDPGIWSELEKRDKPGSPYRKFDNVKLPNGTEVRRVTMKITVMDQAPGLWVDSLPGVKLLGSNNFGGSNFPKQEGPILKGARPQLVLQYGAALSLRDKATDAFRENLNQRVAKLHLELDDKRKELRARLLWITLGAFAALVIGGFWLVHISLLPLNRLSEAVSKVSEKDFRLPLDSKRLPRELVPIAARVSQTLEQLKRAFDREKQAAADISHELRTPVAALLTTVEITLRKPRSASEYREILEDCRSNGQQMHQLVERLLTLARLDAGADLLRPRDVNVSAVTDQCVALVRPLAEARGLQMRVHHNGPALLQADPDKLREVLTNLLHNAIEYNKPDGSIEVNVKRDNGTLNVEVSDTGIGIAPEARQHIFERFFRADPSRHSDSPHAGLGLAIVKGYVELMGGAVDVESAQGVGSTFRVRLPANA